MARRVRLEMNARQYHEGDWTANAWFERPDVSATGFGATERAARRDAIRLLMRELKADSILIYHRVAKCDEEYAKNATKGKTHHAKRKSQRR